VQVRGNISPKKAKDGETKMDLKLSLSFTAKYGNQIGGPSMYRQRGHFEIVNCPIDLHLNGWVRWDCNRE
jgi:hypothetical protein